MTGLGLYGGHRGRRWLKNRVKIFKQFVLPSLLQQTDKDFVLWVSFRSQDRHDSVIQEFCRFLSEDSGLKTVFTFSGVCFWDDKYPDSLAYTRLISAVHGAMPELLNAIGESHTVLMTIQPSDDCYARDAVASIKKHFAEHPDIQVFGFQRGYVMDYINQKLAYWNPKTTPPFYTIKFPREKFVDPLSHMKYTGPYKSHEYVKDFLKAEYDPIERGFLVGTHGENISTIFNHPFAANIAGTTPVTDILFTFGLDKVAPLKLKISLRKILMRKLPHGWQRKLRYWLGERFYARIYEFLRS